MFSFRDMHAGGCFARARLRWAQLALMLLACSFVFVSAVAEQRRDSEPGDAARRTDLPPRFVPPHQGLPVEPEPKPGPAPISNYRKFMDALSRWFSISGVPFESQIKNSQELFGTMNKNAKDSASSIVAIPSTRLVTGRQPCPTASNGAPDCQQGVDALCRTNGFQAGRSVDVTSVQRCRPRAWIGGHPPREGDCRIETFVIRAICQ